MGSARSSRSNRPLRRTTPGRPRYSGRQQGAASSEEQSASTQQIAAAAAALSTAAEKLSHLVSNLRLEWVESRPGEPPATQTRSERVSQSPLGLLPHPASV